MIGFDSSRQNTIIATGVRAKKEKEFNTDNYVDSLATIKPTKEELSIIGAITDKISDQFKEEIATNGITKDIEEKISMQVEKELQIHMGISYEMRSRIKKFIITSMFGLGPLEQYMKDGSSVTDIIVQRFDSICIEDDSGMHRVPNQFLSELHLRTVIQRIVQSVGRQLNLSTPTVNAKLADGSRVHATIPPISPDGATLTIRRFNTRKLDASDYIKLQTMSVQMLDFLKSCVAAKLNILVTGGTGSGKTTLLNMLSGFIAESELIITVEDNCELQLRQPNVRRLEVREAYGDMNAVDMQQLVKETLRMRPDRIIVGETRDGTVVDMFTAMSTGHEGSMSTIHTDSPEALIGSRLPTLFSMYQGATFSVDTQKYMTAEALQLIVQIRRDGKKRKVTHITAVDGFNFATGRIRLVDIFRYDRLKDTFWVNSAPPQSLLSRIRDREVPFNPAPFQGHDVIVKEA